MYVYCVLIVVLLFSLVLKTVDKILKLNFWAVFNSLIFLRKIFWNFVHDLRVPDKKIKSIGEMRLDDWKFVHQVFGPNVLSFFFAVQKTIESSKLYYNN